MYTTNAAIRRAPASSSLYDVMDLILDKGLVIDAYVRVSLVGIEILTIDARIVVASVDTYLRWAERVDRLLIPEKRDVGDLIGAGASRTSRNKTRGALKGAARGVHDVVKHRPRRHVHDDGLLHRVRQSIQHRVGRKSES